MDHRASEGPPLGDRLGRVDGEWEKLEAPDPLPLHLQGVLVAQAPARIGRACYVKGSGAEALDNYFGGQVVRAEGRRQWVIP